MPTITIKIANDTIIPGAHSARPKFNTCTLLLSLIMADSFESGLTSRESQTRVAFFILAVGVPLVGALFALCSTRQWWSSTNHWSLPRLCAMWFVTVAAFATIIFIQAGRTTRSTFVLAIIHGMVEINIISLLLDRTMPQSLLAAMAFALELILWRQSSVSLPNIGHVFIFASILGGANDFLMPLLLLYGRQPLLAVGGFAHTAAAVSVFVAIVHDYGVLTFTIVSFISLWLYVGFIIAGLRASRISDKEYPINPMKASVPRKHLAQLVLVSLVCSTLVTVLLAYVAPTK